ncbi:hypothetical protein B0H66DRAFT_67931 [Apodospora peruviana]|uniref:Uncharacterized protein n=1 Tax=Apodospora peruviana TaxID=516989 RepID=A0AAE0ISP6_9PEZI|nr:hypothetical protein B0H66DRAFT_67931 [Apodospora peruviana]
MILRLNFSPKFAQEVGINLYAILQDWYNYMLFVIFGVVQFPRQYIRYQIHHLDSYRLFFGIGIIGKSGFGAAVAGAARHSVQDGMGI